MEAVIRSGAAPAVEARGPDGPRLLTWSAGDTRGEEARRRELTALLTEGTDEEFHELADRWRTGTDAPADSGSVRGALVASSRRAALTALTGSGPGLRRSCGDRPPRPVALLMSGQGTQHPAMALGLHGADPVFTAEADGFLRGLGAPGDRVRADWLSGLDLPELDDLSHAQPLLYTVGYALARMLMSWGVEPAAYLGHSAGEVVAATLAGVFTPQETGRVLADRLWQIAAAPPGGMLAVAASEAELRPYLHGDVAVGAVNAPRQTMLAGPERELADVEAVLCADGFTCRRMKATSAFHSPVLSGVCALAEPALATIGPKPPRTPLYSCYTGARLRTEEARSARFWALQPAETVRFWPALDTLLGDGDFLVVDASPGQSLGALARLHPAVRSGRSEVAALLPGRRRRPDDDVRAALTTAAALWTEGHEVDLTAVARLG